MNQKVIAAAILACCATGASAQSAVTIYGIADAGFVAERGGVANANKIVGGAASSSRIGFRGTEDLGNGMAALFTLETGVRLDTGALDAANSIFNRQAFVGLKTAAGTVTIGRQYIPWHNTLAQVADPFGTGYAGTSKNLFPDSGANVRASNMILYTAPTTAGFTGQLAYSLGEQAGDSTAGRQIGAAIGYSNGPLNVSLAYNNKNNDVAAAPGVPAVDRSSGRNMILAANYDFKVVRAYAAFNVDKGFNSAPLPNPGNPFGGVAPTASTDGNEILLGLSAPVGTGTVLASVMRKDDKTAFNQDARAWGIGYLYPLSKRTNVYTAYGKVNNRNGAGYTVNNNSESGSGDRAFNLGLRHSF